MENLNIIDIITIITFLGGLASLYIKINNDMINMKKDQEKETALLKKEIESINQNTDKFEKVLDKLEFAIEKLNDSQVSLSQAIFELRTEIRKN
jgi:predicted  nucleic acid-binding Zn-ribbon protein